MTAPASETGVAGPLKLYATVLRLALAAALLAPACRRNIPPEPPPVPVDPTELQRMVDDLRAAADSVRRYQGFLRIRGKGPDGGFSGRLVVVFERPAHLRVELLGAFGSTRWTAVADEEGITVVFPGPAQYVEEADVADVVGRLLGISLSAPEVMALLSGSGAPLDGAVTGGDRRGAVYYVNMAGGERLAVADDHVRTVHTPEYRVRYPSDWKRRGRQIPHRIDLETDALRATLTPEDVDVNVAVAAEAFAVEMPDDAVRLLPSDIDGEAVWVLGEPPESSFR